MSITDRYVSDAGAGTHAGTSEANAFSWDEMLTEINTNGNAAGFRYNVKGAISRSVADSIIANGTTTSPLIIRGYGTTIGDGYQGRTNGNGALVTTNMPTVTYSAGNGLTLGAFVWLESLNIVGAIGGVLVTTGTNDVLRGCKVANTSTNAAATAITPAGATSILDCDVTLAGASGGLAAISAANINCRVIACRITSQALGIRANSTGTFINNTIYGCGTHGIATSATAAVCSIVGNTIVGNTSDGINFLTGSTNNLLIVGNLITDNGRYGINGVSAANAVISAYNRLDRNATANINSATDSLAASSWGVNTTSATQANEYSSYAGNDYRLNGGSPAKANGIPAYAAIGALQPQAGGGVSRARLIGGI